MGKYLAFISLLLISLVACKKENGTQKQDFRQPTNATKSTELITAMTTCREELQADWVADTINVATQLGAPLAGNPYSVAVMQQAAINLYGTTQGITVNRKYIRYKPSTLDQLDLLVNTNIELFDHPLDREVIEEGDYYPQPGIGEAEIPWFYSVVDGNYQPLSGIQYEELAQLYVPDDDINLENEAFRITGNFYDDCEGWNNTIVSPNSICDEQVCPDGYQWDGSLCDCVPICQPGFHWDGTNCVPSPPPPPGPEKQPTGQILVRDFKNVVGGYQDVAVRRTMVVLQRYFKIDKVYTDDRGNFYSTKHFQSKVNVSVKFQNNGITTRGLKGIRFWQTLFPVEQGIGKYSGDLRHIDWTFASSQMSNSKANRNWWSAQLMNAYLEFNENASALGIGALPSDMRILLTSWADAGGAGSTPMNHHRLVNTVSDAYIQQFLVRPASAWWAQAYNSLYNNNIVFQSMDMSLGYNTEDVWASDRVKHLMYHELGHASHFNKVGQSWWNDLVYAESYEIARFGINGASSPYGIGDDGFLSDYISLAESWGEHVGRTIADGVYGITSTTFWLEGIGSYSNDFPVTGLSSHLNYLEDFDPNLVNYPFRWIPDGLYYDMIDTRNENNPVLDRVTGYTNQQFFAALESNVKSLPAFRQKLLLNSGNNQGTEVTQLFAAYGY